ncbi:hypothetical protein CsatB_023412 [Cannabis sativa]
MVIVTVVVILQFLGAHAATIHHKDDSFGDENETTSVIKEKKQLCALVFWCFNSNFCF